MTRHLVFTLWLVGLTVAACGTSGRPTSAAASARPGARSQSAVVAPRPEQRPHTVRSPSGDRDDEYYWLRDDTRTRPEILEILAQENAYADAQLGDLTETKERLYRELVARIPPNDDSVPVEDNGYWYQRRFVEGGEYPIYLRRKGAADGPEQVLLDGNVLARGHAFYRIADYEVSPDGRILAWADDTVGRMQHTLHFKDLESGTLYPDVIENAEAALAWAGDNQTLLYIEKDPETLLGRRVRKHRLGSPPAQDPVVYEEKDESFFLAVWTSRSKRFVNIYAVSTVSSEQWVADAKDPALAFRVLIGRERDHEYLAEDRGDQWILRSNAGAPNFRLLRVPMAQVADRARWQVLIPEPQAGFLEDFDVFDSFFAYTARQNGLSRVHVREWQSASDREIPVAEAASTVTLGDNREVDTRALRYEYTSLSTPLSTLDYDLTSRESKLLKQEVVVGDFQPSRYATEYLQVTARDGTRVPVSLVYRKGPRAEGAPPLYQTAYGAYGSSSDPEFDSARLSLLDRGVTYAIAHVRGGQELGRAWYDQGRLLHKQNTFSDFVDVTRSLVQRGFAARDRVAARGASAGGLLMGAIANQAAGDYRAIVAHVPFVDVVTTMLDASIPLTTNEFDEWGNPQQKPFYDAMLAYSPYDNVRAQAYPALYVTTGLWDSQVQYYEPLKWVARLRTRKTDARPVILRVHMEAGHGGRSGRFVRQEQIAEEYAFVLRELSVSVTPKSH